MKAGCLRDFGVASSRRPLRLLSFLSSAFLLPWSLEFSTFLLACATAVPVSVRSQVTPPGEERVDEAIGRALGYLRTQQKNDGSITDSGNAHAMTALSVMALSAVGNQATDPTPEGETLRKALDYLLANERQRDNGYFGGDGSRMYGHGIVTLTMAELLDMGVSPEQDARIRQRLRKGVDLILWAQDRKERNNEREFGGWRYEPDSRDSDLSVTIWQLMALRAAKNAGLDVPREAIEKAVQYLRKCYKADTKGKERVGGACGYQPGNNQSYAAGAAGLLALQVCGLYESDEVQGSADWLKAKKLEWDGRYFLYGTYYYAQGMYQKGGEYATHARREVEAILLAKQKDDGSWRAQHGEEHNAGSVYGTSMAVLSLCVKYHYLPIYQR